MLDGYFALPPEARIQGLQTFAMPLLKALSDGEMSDDVSFESGTVLLRPTTEGRCLTVLVEVPLHGLEPKTDPQGRRGRRVKRTGDNEVWAKEISDGSSAVVPLNRSRPETRISVQWIDIGCPPNWVPQFATCGGTKISITQRVACQRPCPVTARRCS